MNTHPLKALSSLLIASLLLAGTADAAGRKFLEDYKSGLEAIEAEDWERAADLMQRALGRRAGEARRLPRYVYLKPYLPHFYLGLALFKQGDCKGALKAWQRSEGYGVVQGRPQHEQIELARELCSGQKAAKAPTVAPPSRGPSRAPSKAIRQSAGAPAPRDRRQGPRTEPRRPRREETSRPVFSSPAPAPPREIGEGSHSAPSGPPSAVLLEAAAALLDGHYQEVLDRLSATPPAAPYPRLHAHLLQAASELALFFAEGEGDGGRLERARQHVLWIRSEDPGLEPPERYFSPRFLDFFYGQRTEGER